VEGPSSSSSASCRTLDASLLAVPGRALKKVMRHRGPSATAATHSTSSKPSLRMPLYINLVHKPPPHPPRPPPPPPPRLPWAIWFCRSCRRVERCTQPAGNTRTVGSGDLAPGFQATCPAPGFKGRYAGRGDRAGGNPDRGQAFPLTRRPRLASWPRLP